MDESEYESNTSRRNTHLLTLRDILLAHRVQWYKEAWFIHSFEYPLYMFVISGPPDYHQLLG